MKILIIRPWGKTAFELGGYCKSALAENGHTVELFTYNDERISLRLPFFVNIERVFTQKALLRRISNFGAELILVIKGDRIPPELIDEIKKKFDIPVANYWIDDPHYSDVSLRLSAIYDYFFTNDPEIVQAHKEVGCPHVGFLSFGYLPNLHRKIKLSEEETKKYASDICFVGTVSEKRLKVLEALSDFDLKVWAPRFVYSLGENYRIEKKELPASSPLYSKFTRHAVWGEELVKVYNASKIVLNIHSPQTVPIMRDFEATGCGTFLLTDHARGLEAMFIQGEEIVCYEDIEDLKNKANYYLSHPEEREEIAEKGWSRAQKNHTYARRMGELISFIQKEKI